MNYKSTKTMTQVNRLEGLLQAARAWNQERILLLQTIARCGACRGFQAPMSCASFLSKFFTCT